MDRKQQKLNENSGPRYAVQRLTMDPEDRQGCGGLGSLRGVGLVLGFVERLVGLSF